MKPNLKLSAKRIVDQEFSGKKPGYDALQVDEFLDEVVKDYIAFEQYSNQTSATIEDLNKTCKLLKERLAQVEIQNSVMTEKFKNISDNKDVSLSNLDLLKRISLLEQALYKTGIDPSKIK